MGVPIGLPGQGRENAGGFLLNFLQKFNRNLTDRLWKKERIAFNKKRFHMGIPDRPTRLVGDKSITVWSKIIIKI